MKTAPFTIAVLSVANIVWSQTPTRTVDVSKTGGVEVSVPTGTTGKVYVAPADEPNRPALEADLFRAVAFQVVRQEIDRIHVETERRTDRGPQESQSCDRDEQPERPHHR